jgi:hypothetical protein
MSELHFPPAEEPARDVRLGDLLREELGATPMHAVNWDAFASRVSARVASPWWTYASRWERRVIPIALAAGLAGAALLWQTHPAQAFAYQQPDPVADLVSGTASDVAVRSFARSITYTAVDINSVTPE